MPSDPTGTGSTQYGAGHDVLFLAQLPPPLHGQSAISAAVHAMLHRDPDNRVEHLWRGGAVNNQDIGRRSLRKYWQFATLVGRLLGDWITGRRYSHAYLAMAPWAHTAVRDALLARLARLTARRTLIHIHGAGLDRQLDGAGMKAKLMRACLSGTDLIAITGETAAPARSSGLFRAVHQVRNFAPDPGDPATGDVNDGADGSGDRTAMTLGWLGNLDPRKGVVTFIDAIAALRAGGMAVRGRIGGGSTAHLTLEELHRIVAEKGLADRIEICGHVENDQKSAFFDDVEVFLYPSEHDLVPLVVVEAMAHGAIPIVFDVGGLRDLVGPLLADNVIPPHLPAEQRMARLRSIIGAYAGDRRKRQADRQAARRTYCRMYTPDRFAAAMADVFRAEPNRVGHQTSTAPKPVAKPS